MGNIKTVEITDEILRLVSMFNFKEIREGIYALDAKDLYTDSNTFDIMSHALELRGEHVLDNEESYGARYDMETTEHLEKLDEYISEHLRDIEEVIHQFCTKGVKPGKYTCLSYQHIWKYKEE